MKAAAILSPTAAHATARVPIEASPIAGDSIAFAQTENVLPDLTNDEIPNVAQYVLCSLFSFSMMSWVCSY